MLAPTSPAPPRTSPAGVLRGAAIASAAGVVLGGLTSFGQTVLPDAISSFANSASGLTLLTALVVAALRARPAPSALFATLCFLALVLGYVIVSTLRGYPDHEVFWSVAGVVVGPFVGVATAWLRDRGVRPALGAGLLAGIGIGEAVHGLAVIGDTTSPVYWILIGLAGVALVVATCVRSIDRARDRVLCCATAAVVAGALPAAYLLLSGGGPLTA